MTLPRLKQMAKYWAEHPPVHMAVNAVILGLAGKKRRPREVEGDRDKCGFPTEAKPTNLPQAIAMCGGQTVRFKNYSKTVQ